MSDEIEKVNALPSYSALTEGELLALALEQETLTEGAREALDTELQNRGLGEADVAAFQRDAERRRSRQARWRRAQRLRLRALLAALVIWPGVILIPLGLAFALVFVLNPLVREVLDLSQEQADLCGEIAVVSVVVLYFVGVATFILSDRSNASMRRWLRHRNRKPRSEEEKLRAHRHVCPARNVAIALLLLLFTLYLMLLSLRDVEGWHFLGGQSPPAGWSYIDAASSIFLIIFLAYLLVKAPCLREKLWLVFATTSYLLDLPRHFLHAPSARELILSRDISLLLWSAATVVALTFVKSAWQGPATRDLSSQN